MTIPTVVAVATVTLMAAVMVTRMVAVMVTRMVAVMVTLMGVMVMHMATKVMVMVKWPTTLTCKVSCIII